MKISGIRFTIFLNVAFTVILCVQNLQAFPKLNSDTTILRTHRVRIKGKSLKYESITGLLPVLNKGKSIASVFFTYYRRRDVTNSMHRPIIFHFNGGYGASSKLLHMGYTSPRIASLNEEGYPIQPYGVVENTHSILDVADLVYIDPVGTGYSKVVGMIDSVRKADSRFFNEPADVEYLGVWISSFLKRYNRLLSPLFLLGESAGGRRVCGLSGKLMKENIPVNGIILVSSANIVEERDIFTDARSIFRDKPRIYSLIKENSNWESKLDVCKKLVTNALAARYYGCIPNNYLVMGINKFEEEVENFALNQYFPALLAGIDCLSLNELDLLASKISAYTGINKEELLVSKLEINFPPLSSLSKLFLKSAKNKGLYGFGKYDIRYNEKIGPTDIVSINHAYHNALLSYIDQELGFKTSMNYGIAGGIDFTKYSDYLLQTLKDVMKNNPFMQILAQAGYYDPATDIVSQKINLTMLDQKDNFKNRIHFRAYEAGHMFYVRKSERLKALDDLREFVIKAVPKPGHPAKYLN